MIVPSRIVPCLWFQKGAEAAVNDYLSIFENSRILSVSHYTEVGHDHHGQAPGTVMTLEFELEGHRFTALNGGPAFQFNEAVSFQVLCDSQAEIDHYWNRLTAGGDPRSQQCGWLKDKHGVSWQVSPRVLGEWIHDPDPQRAARMMGALLQMKKLDIAQLERARAG